MRSKRSCKETPVDLERNNKLIENARRSYTERFGKNPEVVVFAPGRINLIGEHTDYNKGFVMPSAVQHGMYFALGSGSANTSCWVALDKQEEFKYRTGDDYQHFDEWQDFVFGAAKYFFGESNSLNAFNCVFTSDLPEGSGMSSSSALTCGILFGLNELFNGGRSRYDIAVIAHKVEHEFVGLKGGIMDQFAAMLSEVDQLILLDCRSLERTMIPFDRSEVCLFFLHSNVHRELTSSDYNNRADECQEIVETLGSDIDGLTSLRDLEPGNIDQYLPKLNATLQKRLRYVLEENARVLESAALINKQDWNALGGVLLSGHAGLRDLYNVSIPEIDFLVEFAQQYDWIYGSRLMGGGFGGCTVNLASRMPDSKFIDDLNKEYYARFGIKARLIQVSLDGGASRIS